MKEMRQDRLAFDLQSARTIDPHSGHMHVRQTNISKATVNPYLGSEIPGGDELGLDPNKKYALLRHPQELAKAAETFNGKPLVLSHKAQAVDDKDHLNRVGSVGNAVYDHPYLKADLSVWDQAAIDAIETNAQRELSCGYAYTPDMTPGTYEGQRYDGVMRELGGNHVALVREGRAGADCHVFDSMEGLHMNRTVAQSRTAIAGPIALAALLRPKMAKDAKPINWGPTFKGVDAKNFKSKKAAMAADMKRQLQGKLAKDANMNDVMELLDALEDIIPEVGPDVDFKQITDMPDPSAPPADAMDDDMAEMRAFLKSKGMSDEDIDMACGMVSKKAEDDSEFMNALAGSETGGGGGSADPAHPNNDPGVFGVNTATDPDAAAQGSTGPARDAEDPDLEQRVAAGKAFTKKVTGMDAIMKTMVTRSAMDQALAVAVKAATESANKNQAAIRDAERTIQPWCGHLPMSFDSAENVYRAALNHLGVEGADRMHSDALLPVLKVQPKPGEQQRLRVPAFMAQDAAATSEYATRFGNSARLKN